MSEAIEQHHKSPERENDALSEAIKNADRVTVEIGTANTPLFKVGQSEYNDSNLYVGVNIDPAQHAHLRAQLREDEGHAVLSSLDEQGKIERLPLLDDSVDTVFMGNVFGEPDDKNIMEQFRMGDGQYHGHSSLDSKKATLEEAKRIMKQDGHIVILETNTPYLGEVFEDRFTKEKYAAMAKILAEQGFLVDAALTKKSEEWRTVVSNFAEPNDWWSDFSYVVIASK